MAHTACLVCLTGTVSDHIQTAKNVALVAGTQPNLSNLFLYIPMV